MKAWGITSKSEWYNLPDWERHEKIALEIVEAEIQSHIAWQQEKDAKMRNRGRK